jgi:pectinesterase
MNKTFLLLALAFFGLGSFALHAQSANKPKRVKVRPVFTEGIRIEGSMIFTYVDEKRRRRLTLDLYKPEKQDGPLPAIVMYFGGGWQNGRPALFAPLGQALAQRGYVCVVPEYRLSSEAPFPVAVHDCKAAIRWTRANAKRFGIDPDRIATIGGSAGGHLSGFMGATTGIDRFEGGGDHRDHSSEVQASIVMCGAMDLLDPHILQRIAKAKNSPRGDSVIDFLGGNLPTKNKAVYKEASPLTHVGAHAPPYLFIDGEFDRPKVRYVDFRKRLDAHKIPNQFVLMPKGPHPFWGSEQWFFPTVDAVDAFLKKHLPAKK